MKTPTLHLNGTSGTDLLDNYDFASQAVRRAIEGLCDARPNPRDYYTQGNDAFRLACEEHNARVAKLQSVLEDVRAIHESVQTQMDERGRR